MEALFLRPTNSNCNKRGTQEGLVHFFVQLQYLVISMIDNIPKHGSFYKDMRIMRYLLFKLSSICYNSYLTAQSQVGNVGICVFLIFENM